MATILSFAYPKLHKMSKFRSVLLLLNDTQFIPLRGLLLNNHTTGYFMQPATYNYVFRIHFTISRIEIISSHHFSILKQKKKKIVWRLLFQARGCCENQYMVVRNQLRWSDICIKKFVSSNSILYDETFFPCYCRQESVRGYNPLAAVCVVLQTHRVWKNIQTFFIPIGRKCNIKKTVLTFDCPSLR